MKVYKEETVAHLHGDLNQSGVIYNIINLLSVSLEKIISGGEKKIRIDCELIRNADIRGLQMLNIWTQSAKGRGVEPELINMPRSLRQAMKKMGFDNCFKIISKDKNTHGYINKQEKTIVKHERRGELCLSI